MQTIGTWYSCGNDAEGKIDKKENTCNLTVFFMHFCNHQYILHLQNNIVVKLLPPTPMLQFLVLEILRADLDTSGR